MDFIFSKMTNFLLIKGKYWQNSLQVLLHITLKKVLETDHIYGLYLKIECDIP